ncbi:NAD(P)-dependent oxidoreductase [Polaromonas naphthalenivorans]|uniref:FAD-dependent pyridine nucleotide-disulfide oxidoreductase n=1 Tax=Polaromonas naphthalenivorans (strain CJ2) TaxID=365044 RepID=A1VUI3_POLNA|nr:NAD(P)-dependent oxidoreductase [Polaromonas naphthalenivorans]ABM39311.1 FAD-dependent pyridine nucleotide-disulfide oxidoreductase [Polaromonas naphthalenivorans CJ2]
MSTPLLSDIRAGRLGASDYALRFADASPRLTGAQAVLEAERCLYCYDAPCVTACPTGIDVPSFIRRIGDGNVRGAARTILESNPLGGMCARVCPTETLCEAACVRTTQEGKPVAIGRLQRHAVDAVMESDRPQLFTRAPSTGRRVAVVGAGPAGLACAHTLALLGHEVVVFDAQAKAGGLNEYGLAAYKTPDNFAQREVQWLLAVGGIEVRTGWKLDTVAQLDALRQDYGAVFLGMGLSSTQKLGVPGEDLAGVEDAVDFIARLRQSEDKSLLPIGRRVVVIGGGMTAVDAAVQSRLLGAESVHIAYRRGPETMSASVDEQHWAQTNGVTIRRWLAPVEISGEDGQASGVMFARQALVNGQLQPTGETEFIAADMVFKAIGQTLGNPVLTESGLAMQGGRIKTAADGATSLPGVWAGGDCRTGGLDLTVEAVAHGKAAAQAIHAHISR